MEQLPKDEYPLPAYLNEMMKLIGYPPTNLTVAQLVETYPIKPNLDEFKEVIQTVARSLAPSLLSCIFDLLTIDN